MRNNEIEIMLKESAVDVFKFIFQHMPGGTEENFKKPPPDFRSKF
jgi:hypothetical protein